ncbi:NUDIX domain-containing protein [Flavicella sp.]|nr:NUDIX domain-containing protein [Flavicella sp.]MDA9111773.1 NUDIX domain-containing protein [Flavicella sp.]
MDEYIELLNLDGAPNGTRCLKSVAHQKGYFHATVHVWFYTPNGDVLLQKRNPNKETFPNLWDVSVAGHIAFSEAPVLAAKREVLEEIGLPIQEKDLIEIGNSTHKNTHGALLIDWELHHLFLCELADSDVVFNLQEEEVAAVKWISLKNLEAELKHPKLSKGFVPHGNIYYAQIFNAIRNQLC